jgi:pimeloyl-ACP methyl ester carboxylesterase
MSNDSRRSRRTRIATVAAGAASVAAAGYAASRVLARRAERGRAPGGGTDLEMPADVVTRDVETKDGARIRVVERGEGPAVVLLHGAGLSADLWAYQFHDLADRRHLVAFDLRGHGDSEAGGDGMTVAAMADDLAAVLEALDVRRALLVGHSMGGMTVLRFARKHRDVLEERVASVLLVATTGGLTPDISVWHRLSHLAGRTAVAVDRTLNPDGRHIYPGGELGYLASRVGFGARPTLAEVEATTRMLRRMQPARFVGLLPELLSFDERDRYTDLDLPVTVLAGGRDVLTPPLHSRMLAASLPGARLLVWKGAGHMLMYERRADFDRLLEELSSGGGEQAGEAVGTP